MRKKCAFDDGRQQAGLERRCVRTGRNSPHLCADMRFRVFSMVLGAVGFEIRGAFLTLSRVFTGPRNGHLREGRMRTAGRLWSAPLGVDK
jgi:hypothetical protein